MRRYSGWWWALGVLAISAVCTQADAQGVKSADTPPADRMAWWREARFGMFIHWGLYAVPAGDWNGKTCGGPSEWIMQSLKIPVSEYRKFAPQFNPTKYDPVAWAKLAKEAGCRYVVITSRHHDGFCLWDSGVSDWDVMATPWKKDLLRPLADACRAEGLKFGLYYSIKDWRHPDYTPRRAWNDDPLPPDGSKFDRFVEYVHAQVEEIIRGYDPDILWFDGEWEETWTTAHGEALEALCRRLKPGIILNNRVGKSRDDMAGLNKPGVKSLGDFCTPEQEVPSRGLPGIDWETCMTMNNSWGFKRSDHAWKSEEQIVRTLCEVAGKGGNFLLNVGPTAEGEIPPESVERLLGVGKWLKAYGPSIYGTTIGPFARTPWGSATQRDRTLYLHLFGWPEGQTLDVHALRTPFKAKEMGSGREFPVVTADGRGRVEAPLLGVDETFAASLGPSLVLLSDPGLSHTPVLELVCETRPVIVERLPRPGPDGVLSLGVLDAEVLPPAKIERLGGQPNVGFWTSPRSTVRWKAELPAGRYRVEAEMSCLPSAAGNTYRIAVGGGDEAILTASTRSTGGWDRFEFVRVGEVNVPDGGEVEVVVGAVGKVEGALMNLRSVRLTPAGTNPRNHTGENR